MVPFSGAAYYVESNRTYNFYLSQLRICIEMAFGRLTTKWRVVRNALNFGNAKNAKIVRVCTKLHNYCIRMEQLEGCGRVGRFSGESVDPVRFGIDPLPVGANRIDRSFGFMDTTTSRDDSVTSAPRVYSSLTADSSLRDSLVADVESRTLCRPMANRERNG